MNNEHKKSSVDFLIYNIPAVVSLLLSFFLLPVYTAYLTPEDYGIRAVVLLAILIFQGLANFGVKWVVRGKYFVFSSESDKKAYLTTVFIASLVPRLILVLALYYVAADLFPFFFKSWDNVFTRLFKIQLLIFLINFAQELFFVIMKMGRQSLKYAKITLLTITANHIVALLLIIHYHYGVYSLFYGELAGSALFFIVSFFFIRKEFSWDFRKEAITDLIKIGMPAVPKGFFKIIQRRINKYILQIYMPVGELGLFANSEFLERGFAGMNQAFADAFSPNYIKKVTQTGCSDKSISKIMIYWLFLLSCLLIFLILFLEDIFKIMGVNQAFWICAKYAPFLALSILITGYPQMYGHNVVCSKKTYLFTIRAVIAGTINVLINLLLIPRYGIQGAIIATLITGMCIVGIEYYFSERVLAYNTNLNYWIYVLIIAIVIVLYGLVWFNILVSFYARSVVMVCYILLLIFFDYFIVKGLSRNRFAYNEFRNVSL